MKALTATLPVALILTIALPAGTEAQRINSARNEHVTFIVRAGSRSVICAIRRPGAVPVQVVRPLGSFLEHAWRPDGRRLVVVRGMRGKRALDAMSPDGRAFKRLATVVNPRRGGPFVLESPRWSSDGRWIVFSSSGSIVLIRSDGRERRILRRGGDGLSGYADPWFSLHGERVYYTYWQIGPVAGQLLSVRLDGSDARAETPRSYVYGNLYGEEPTPDLRWRVYERWQDHAVVVAPFGETHERVIAPPSLRHAGGFRWSLDTSEVVYRRRGVAADAPADLFTAGFEGVHETQLTNTPTRDERDPSWAVSTSVQFGRCPGYE